MRRVYQRGEVKHGYAVNHDVMFVRLHDGRCVLITGMEALQNGFRGPDDPRILEFARELAYDSERQP